MSGQSDPALHAVAIDSDHCHRQKPVTIFNGCSGTVFSQGDSHVRTDHSCSQSSCIIEKISSFHPPRRALIGPGPSEINPGVLAQMLLPAIGYLDPVFVEMMEELKTLLRYAYQTDNALTFPVSGPGSVSMEACFINAVSPGAKVWP